MKSFDNIFGLELTLFFDASQEIGQLSFYRFPANQFPGKKISMEQDSYARVAILCSGNREARRNTTAENSRFSDLFGAFAAKRIYVEPAIYHDDFCEERSRTAYAG